MRGNSIEKVSIDNLATDLKIRSQIFVFYFSTQFAKNILNRCNFTRSSATSVDPARFQKQNQKADGSLRTRGGKTFTPGGSAGNNQDILLCLFHDLTYLIMLIR